MNAAPEIVAPAEQQEEQDEALTVRQFCARYKMSRSKFYGLVATGDLSAKKTGKLTLVKVAEARRWFDALPDLKSGAAG